MKLVDDPTLSKRPFRVHDEADIDATLAHIQQLGERVEALDRSLEIRTGKPRYDHLVDYSKKRMVDIAMGAMKLSADDTLGHAEAIGQFNERLFITKELEGIRIIKNQTVKFIDIFKEKCESLKRKFEKKEKQQK